MSRNPVVAAWARLQRAAASTRSVVEDALKRADLPPLAWYDVLLELEHAGGPMRPNALERRLLFAQSNLSRLLDRMEAQGLVSRTAAPDDGRGRLVNLTLGGLDLRRRMWRVYGPAIRRAMGDDLSPEELRVLGELSARLGRGAAPHPGGLSA